MIKRTIKTTISEYSPDGRLVRQEITEETEYERDSNVNITPSTPINTHPEPYYPPFLTSPTCADKTTITCDQNTSVYDFAVEGSVGNSRVIASN